MLILHHKEYNQLNLIFGLGMIGVQVLAALKKGNSSEQYSLPFDWGNDTKQERECRKIEEKVAEIKRKSENSIVRINVLWSAGKGGFALNRPDMGQEIKSFRQVLNIAKNLRRILINGDVSFHLISSAGGLFEGQINVSRNSIPNPRRPYGELKLMQEDLLEKSDLDAARIIYRPSTVYGFSGFDKRIGLIVRLLWDRMNNRVTHIFGSLETIRDYVYAGDIGKYIADVMLNNTRYKLQCYTLINGKPTTINEILRIVEKIHPRKPYLHYMVNDFNSENNSYRNEVSPVNWTATDLETGIRLVYGQLFTKV